MAKKAGFPVLKVVSLAAWVGGVVVFYRTYLDTALKTVGATVNDGSRMAALLVFAGVWALAVNFALWLVPTSTRAKLG